jgi:hypothetical protein
MTGFLNLDQLRVLSAPRDHWPDRGRAPTRPRLVAQWECASDGRLICRWRIDDRTEPEASTSVRSFGRAA